MDIFVFLCNVCVCVCVTGITDFVQLLLQFVVIYEAKNNEF
jgi:hypothetical protein